MDLILDTSIRTALETAARAAARHSYCPYSRFPVGAAVLAEDGRIFAGCNVENASFGLTICAERNAVQHAVSEGAQVILAVVIYTPTASPTASCGACRQVIREFGSHAMIVCICDGDSTIETCTEELLPESFGPHHVQLSPGVADIVIRSRFRRRGDQKSLRLCVDIDNVVAQTDVVMRQVIREVTNGRVNLSYADISRFNYWECKDQDGNGISREEWKAVHEAFSQPERLLALEPIEGVQQCLREISQCYSIHFATSRLPIARKATVQWLERAGLPKHDLHFLQHGEKHLSLGAFFASVEDDLAQAEAFAATGIKMSIVLAHPWNECVAQRRNLRRMSGWSQVADELIRLRSEL